MFKLFYEDLVEGQKREVGKVVVDRGEVIEFATRYDPQPFHINEELAKQSVFGGLCASGWHTSAMMMRLHVDDIMALGLAAMGSPGIDSLNFLKPVFPGDTLSLMLEIGKKRISNSRPHMGFVKFHDTVVNQDGVAVLTMTANMMILLKNPGKGEAG